MFLSWNSPCKSNGHIEHFKLQFKGRRSGYDDVQFERIVHMDFSNNGSITYTETDLKPEYSYTVNASVKTEGVEEYSDSITSTFEAPAGSEYRVKIVNNNEEDIICFYLHSVPQKLDSETMASARVEAYENSNPSKIAIVRFPANILKSDYGTILYVALLLSQKVGNRLRCDIFYIL